MFHNQSTLKELINSKPPLQRLWIEENDKHIQEPIGMKLNIWQQCLNKWELEKHQALQNQQGDRNHIHFFHNNSEC